MITNSQSVATIHLKKIQRAAITRLWSLRFYRENTVVFRTWSNHVSRYFSEILPHATRKLRRYYLRETEKPEILYHRPRTLQDAYQSVSIFQWFKAMWFNLHEENKKKNTEESNLTKKKKKKKEKTKNEITTQTKKKNRIFTVRSVPSPARVINHGISWIKSVTGFSLARAREREGRKEMQRLGRWFLLNRLCWTV